MGDMKVIAYLKRALIIGGAIALSVTLGLLVLRGRDPKIRLRSGEQFALTTVTFGTNHSYPFGRPLAKFLVPYLSPKWRNRLGVYEYQIQTESAAIAVWGQWSQLRSNYPPAIIRFVDDHGVESEPILGLPVPSPKNQERLDMVWKCLNYPRRAKTLKIRLYRSASEGKQDMLGEVVTSNPTTGSYPQWNPASLPQKVATNRYECELLNFVPGDVALKSISGRPGKINGHIVLLRMSREGRPARDWTPLNITVTDATENVVKPPYVAVDPIDNFLAVSFTGTLWPSERAWKLTMRLVKNSEFVTNQTFDIRDVVLPKHFTGVQVLTNIDVQGVTVLSLSINRSSNFPQPGEFARENAEVLLLAPSTHPDIYISLVSVVDKAGRRIRFGQGTSGTRGWRYPLELPGAAETLTFQFAVQQVWAAEFTAAVEKAAESVNNLERHLK